MNKKLSCVLLIDDDEPTNYYNSLIIEETGCANHVQVEQSGVKALEYLVNSEDCPGTSNGSPYPDLIFLDINMPAMNGWEFLEEYKKLPEYQRGAIVVVMLTASPNPDDESKAGSLPSVSGFLNKPLTPETLHRVLKENFIEYTE